MRAFAITPHGCYAVDCGARVQCVVDVDRRLWAPLQEATDDTWASVSRDESDRLFPQIRAIIDHGRKVATHELTAPPENPHHGAGGVFAENTDGDHPLGTLTEHLRSGAAKSTVAKTLHGAGYRYATVMEPGHPEGKLALDGEHEMHFVHPSGHRVHVAVNNKSQKTTRLRSIAAAPHDAVTAPAAAAPD